jgi:hypothetical protein
MMIVNDDSRVINKLETSLTDNARVIIYDRHMFIVQTTESRNWQLIYIVYHCAQSIQQTELIKKIKMQVCLIKTFIFQF